MPPWVNPTKMPSGVEQPVRSEGGWRSRSVNPTKMPSGVEQEEFGKSLDLHRE